MEKRHIQSFLMASAAFFALNAAARPAQPLAPSSSNGPASAHVQNSARNNASRS
jgi:hypothetical protein